MLCKYQPEKKELVKERKLIFQQINKLLNDSEASTSDNIIELDS